MDDVGVDSGAAIVQASKRHPRLRLAASGSVATLAAMVATTSAAAFAEAVGVDFEIPDGGAAIPLPAFAVVTGFCSVIGIAIAVALRRWTTRPAERFVWTAASLTAISLIPPCISGADTATIGGLLGLHLVAATIVILSLARRLRADCRAGYEATAQGVRDA